MCQTLPHVNSVAAGRHSDSAGDDEDEDEVSNEDLLLVAAVSLGELAARFLDIAGASSDDSLWDLLDELRGLTEVRRESMQQLAVSKGAGGSVLAPWVGRGAER